MLYDYREGIYRELIAVDESDDYYFSKRFKRALLMFDEADRENLLGWVSEIKERFGVEKYALRDLERFFRNRHAIKLRTEDDIVLVSRNDFFDALNEVDEWVDNKVVEYARKIRFSEPVDATKISRSV